MNKSVFFSTFVLACLMLVLGFKFFATSSLEAPITVSQPAAAAEQKPTVSLITIYQQIDPTAEVSTQYDKVTTQSGKTALDLLSKTHHIQTKGEGKNAFITSIDDKTADDTQKELWAFYVNGKQAQVNAASYQLKSGDEVQWKIETKEN